jgi:hypothetical protein
LSCSFRIRNGSKKETLCLLLSTFDLGNTIRKLQENQEGLGLNVTQLLAYAGDASLLGENIHNVKKNTEAML